MKRPTLRMGNMPRCGIRFQADKVNTLFERNLKQFVPKPGMAELFRAVICDSYVENGGRSFSDQSRKIDQIAEQNTRKARALELLMSKVISATEYQQIKSESENTIARCEAELKELSSQVDDDLDIEGLAALAVENLKNLPEFYANADSDIKRAIVGSIYPEKWFFDGETHRTPEINETAQLIYQINRKLGHKKSGVKSVEDFYSAKVLPFELNSKKFIDDLRKIARIGELVAQEPLRRDFALKYKRTWKKKKDKK